MMRTEIGLQRHAQAAAEAVTVKSWRSTAFPGSASQAQFADTSRARRVVSASARVLSKLLISAPEMNAFRPAPRMITTLMRIGLIGFYHAQRVLDIPGDRAFSLPGLSQISQPMEPFVSASTSPDVSFPICQFSLRRFALLLM